MGRAGRIADECYPAVPHVHHVAVLDDVVLALQAQGAAGAGVGFRAGFEQGVPVDDLGADEVLLQIGVDGAGGLDGACSTWNSPGAAFVLAHGEKGDKAHQFVGLADEPHQAAFLQVVAGEELGG